MTEAGSFSQEIINTDAMYLSPSIRLAFFPLVVRTGAGAVIEDHDGRRYIDFLSMAAIMNTGYGHPRIVKAIRDQATELIHCNPAYAYHAPLAVLNRELVRITPGTFAKKIAYGLSGGDANDGAIKLARAATGRQKVIAFLRSYHGNTYGALSLSSVSTAMRRGFGPFLPEVYHVPYPDCYRCPVNRDPASCRTECLGVFHETLQTLAPAGEVAAVFMELIQGDSGVIVPPQSFVDGVVTQCRENGILFVAEEVQTGMGRTGKWFACEHFGIEPDMLILGKALGSGVPISAIVARAELMDAWASPGHVLCTAANPIACAAATATIGVIEDEQLVARAADIGGYLRQRLQDLSHRFPIGQVRGHGLMLGVDLVTNRDTRQRAETLAAMTAWRCYELGLLVTFFSGSVLRICPPLVIGRDQIDRACDILEQALSDAMSGSVPAAVADRVRGW